MFREQFFDQLLLLSAHLQEDQERELAAIGLTPRTTHLLWIIHQRGPLMQREIADEMQVTQRWVTTLVDELIDAHLVYREPHPHDRRAVLIRLAEKGTSIMETMAADHVRIAEALTDGWSEAEVTALTARIESVVTRFTSLVDEAAQEREDGSP
ncbi:MAG: MarR family transcriptional regulator [Microbacterium sp.]